MGSVTDYMALVRAFERYEAADRIMRLFGGRHAIESANGHYAALVMAARRCGWTYSLRETCHAWAARRVATLEAVLPNHVADQRRAA